MIELTANSPWSRNEGGSGEIVGEPRVGLGTPRGLGACSWLPPIARDQWAMTSGRRSNVDPDSRDWCGRTMPSKLGRLPRRAAFIRGNRSEPWEPVNPKLSTGVQCPDTKIVRTAASGAVRGGHVLLEFQVSVAQTSVEAPAFTLARPVLGEASGAQEMSFCSQNSANPCRGLHCK